MIPDSWEVTLTRHLGAGEASLSANMFVTAQSAKLLDWATDPEAEMLRYSLWRLLKDVRGAARAAEIAL